MKATPNRLPCVSQPLDCKFLAELTCRIRSALQEHVHTRMHEHVYADTEGMCQNRRSGKRESIPLIHLRLWEGQGRFWSAFNLLSATWRRAT